jgi:YidC/Oxa1 family membrane protein insertase
MDKRTLLAVVLSVVIIVGGMILQSVFAPPKPAAAASAQKPATTQPASPQGQQPPQAASPAQTAQATAASPAQQARTNAKLPAVAGAATAIATGQVVETADSAPPATQPATIQAETDLYSLTFDTAGGTLSSVKLRKYKNVDGSLVNMLLLPKTMSAEETPFALAFGNYKANPITVPFTLHETTDADKTTFDFSRAFYAPNGVPFTLHKTYLFYKNEYLFQLQITIQNSVNDFPALNVDGYAYTLTLGPQIGPHYAKLDGRNDFRKYAYWADNKRQDPGVGMGQLKELDKSVTWAGIEGKYFTAIAVPDGAVSHLVFDSRKLVEGFDRSAISFERPALKSAASTDTYRFYMGPMKKEVLARYNDAAQNKFGIAGLHADEMVTSSILIGWLAQLLKYLLDFFYLIIPNYGVAIILLTILQELRVNGQDGRAEPQDPGDPHTPEGEARQDEPGDRRAVPQGEDQPLVGMSPPAAADPRVLRPVQPAEQLLRASRRHVHSRVDPRPFRARGDCELPVHHSAAGMDGPARVAPAHGCQPTPPGQVHAAGGPVAGRRSDEAHDVRASDRFPFHPL